MDRSTLIRERDKQRRMIQEVLDQTKIESLSQLARRAGVVPTTLTRWWKEPEARLLSSTTIAKLQAVGSSSAPTEGGNLAHEEEKLLLLEVWSTLEHSDKVALMHIMKRMVSVVPNDAEAKRRAR